MKAETIRSKIVTEYLIRESPTFNHMTMIEKTIAEIASNFVGFAMEWFFSQSLSALPKSGCR